MSERNTDHTSPLEASISRETLIKKGAALAGAGALAATVAPGLAGATINNQAPFYVNGRAKATITFAAWGDATSIKPFQKTMQKFMARNQAIDVKLINIAASGWASLFETVLTRIAAGTAPDIMRIAIEGVALFGAKNLALPMNDFMKKDAEYVQELHSDTPQVTWDVLAYKGKQLALPFSYNNMMVWYNTQVWKQMGMAAPKLNWTGDDFLAMCAQLKKQGKYGTSLWAGGLFGMEAWSLAAGTNLLSDDWTKSTATAAGNLTAWQFLYDLVWKYKYAPRPGKIPETTFFESGRLGTFLAGRWPLQQLLQDKFKDADVQFFPVLNGGPRKVIFGIDGYPIIRTTKYPEAAWELAKYMSSKETMRDWMIQGTNIPCRKSQAYASWMNPPKNYHAFMDSLLAGATAVTSPPQYNEIDTAVTKWFSKMMAQQVAPKGALAGLDQDITAILKKPV